MERRITARSITLRQKIAPVAHARLLDLDITGFVATTRNREDEVDSDRLTFRDLDSLGLRIENHMLLLGEDESGRLLRLVLGGEIYGDDVIYKNYVHMGVAVGTPNGLVVPVVRDADRMSFAEIEKKIAELGLRARDGKLSMAEMQGGTFTISNGGVYGSLMSSPILNPPQSGILGMHKIQDRPVAIKGQVVIRPMMYLALSYDHRIVDGKGAVTFLVRVKEALEDPRRLLMDL